MAEVKRAIAIGFFDGVHAGHAALLNITKQRASENMLTPSVMSFDVHPDTLVFEKEVPLITSVAGREEIIRRCFGINDVIFLHFNYSLMNMEWEVFADTIISELNLGWIVVGHDFTFGRRGEGTAEKLKAYCSEREIGCDVIPPVRIDGKIVSSTYIRKLIEEGEIEEANRFLGRAHSLTDTVHPGIHLGRSLGAPTINMSFQPGVVIPRYGVYAARVILDGGEEHIAVANVGVRPTISENNPVNVESHILDYDGNLYGRRVRVDFHSFIRPERRFESVAALSAQIEKDTAAAVEYFEKKI